jgi:hypothetical protein
MTDLKINWSAAPEGATHYDNDPKNPSWVRYLQGAESCKLFELFYWSASDKEWVPVSGYILGTLTPKPEAAPTKKDKSADMVKNPSHYQLLFSVVIFYTLLCNIKIVFVQLYTDKVTV